LREHSSVQGRAVQREFSRFLPRTICHLFTGCRQASVLWDSARLRDVEKCSSEAFRDTITPTSPVQQLLCFRGGKPHGRRAPSLGKREMGAAEEPSQQAAEQSRGRTQEQAGYSAEGFCSCLDPKTCDAG